MKRRPIRLRTYAPPADPITPEAALHFMRHQYRPLAGLAALGGYSRWLRPPRHSEEIAAGARALAVDLPRIVAGCVRAIETGKPVRLVADPCEAEKPNRTRDLRLLVEYERRFPHRGARGFLRRSLRERERRARRKGTA